MARPPRERAILSPYKLLDLSDERLWVRHLYLPDLGELGIP